MLDTLLPILLFSALVLAGIGAVRRIRLWRQGRREGPPLGLSGVLRALSTVPRRYMVDLHHVVARDRYIAHTHVATAGGFVAAMLLAVPVHGLGLDSPWLGGPLLVASGTMFVGSLFVARRRRRPPARLSRGAFQRLPKSLMAFSLSFFLITLPVVGVVPAAVLTEWGGWLLGLVLAAGIVWGLAELLLGMTWGGPMKHAFAGALHLAFHRRGERFSSARGEGVRSTGLKPLDLDDPTAKLGVETPADFIWTQRLGFDACVQCGRCEAVCPAFAAGQPLNPKKLIQDMVIGMTGGSDAAYAGSPHPSQGREGNSPGEHQGNPHGPIVAREGKALVDAETLWSCTTCRACVEECPMMIEHVDAIVDMRRFLTLEHGNTPGKGAEVLDNLIATDNPGGFAPGSRLHWAADLNLPQMSEVDEAEVLLWLGDGAFDMRNQRTLRALVKVLRSAEVDFAVLGDEERDSGDVARRLGDEATFQSLARRNIATLSKYRFRRIVTCDPHSFHVLGNEYGALGGDYRVQHHSTFIAELYDIGRLSFAPWRGGRVTYHDPCYLGRYNGEFEAPRRVLKALGIEVVEMARSGFRSRCCGGGGGAPITDVPGKQRIPDMRMQDVGETGAELVAVSCPQCTAMLEGVVDATAEVRDIAELVADALAEVLPSGEAPSQRHQTVEVM
ncbi:(Fe-S)-binding protein [Halomonas sp. YLGW01]|uniref:(Fe-S)-binding protein n=1 Tax=Halomonas sp. YLGW01 TaxID=2773308 RepID=UPI0017813A87|nr:(Fe-S)-binding protein [Halomonas sp. YLGW01]